MPRKSEGTAWLKRGRWYVGVMIRDAETGKRKQVAIMAPEEISNEAGARELARTATLALSYLERTSTDFAAFAPEDPQGTAAALLEGLGIALPAGVAGNVLHKPDSARHSPAGADSVRGASSLADAVDKYAKARRSAGLAAGSLRNIRTHLGHLKRITGEDTPVAEAMSVEALREFRSERAESVLDHPNTKNRGEVSLNRDARIISHFADWCVEEGLIDANHTKRALPALKEASMPRVLYSEAEIARLIAAGEEYAPKFNRSRLPWGLAIRLLFEGGFRRGELAHLQWRDFDLAKPGAATVTVQPKPGWRPKDSEFRTIPLTEAAAQGLVAHRDWLLAEAPAFAAPDAYLLTWGTKQPRGAADRLRGSWKGVWKHAGVDWRGLHACRHTAAMRWVRGGLNPVEVQRLLGHARLDTTMIYFQWYEAEGVGEKLRKALGEE